MKRKQDPEERKRKMDVLFSKLKRMTDEISEDEEKTWTSQSEADTTDVNNFSSVGAPTCPSTDFKPLSPIVQTPENSATCNVALKVEIQESEETSSVKNECKHPQTVQDSAVTNSEESEKNKGYEAFSMVTSKNGRFDHATINRSESPLNCADAKPSSPFQ